MIASVSAITRSSSTTNTLGLAGWPFIDVKIKTPGLETQRKLYARHAHYQRCWFSEKSDLAKANPKVLNRLLTCWILFKGVGNAQSSRAGVVLTACGRSSCPDLSRPSEQFFTHATNADSTCCG